MGLLRHLVSQRRVGGNYSHDIGYVLVGRSLRLSSLSRFHAPP